jgi:hypothetical protein
MGFIMARLASILLIYTILLYSSIDDEIDKIQKAPIDERFKLMNELKEKIAKMQEDRRMESINKLKSVTNGELITLDINSSKKKYIKKVFIEHINSSITEHSRGADDD